MRRVADQGRGRARGIEQVGQVAVDRLVAFRDEIPELDRTLVLAARLGVGVDRARGVAGRDRRAECPRRVLRRPPVMGDLDESCRGRDPGTSRLLLDRPGIGRVQQPALGREKSVVGGLLDQRMPELIAFDGAVLIDEQQLGLDGATERRTEPGSGSPHTWARSSWSTWRPATAGTNRASSGRLGPAASAIRSGSTWRASDRRASTIGPNGRPSSPRATAPPSMTSQSRARTRATASSTRRLLPTPASPPTRTSDGWPSAAKSAAERSVFSSSVRPTKIGLLRRRAMPSMIGPGRRPSTPLRRDDAGPGSGVRSAGQL